MRSKTKIKIAIFNVTFGSMAIADYYLADKAEYFNLYHLLLSIFTNTEKHYIIFQQNLGSVALPIAITTAALFHITLSNIIYKSFNLIINRRNHEKA